MSRSQVKSFPVNDITGYREIERLSYSALKMYEEDRKKFKLIHIEKNEEVIKKYKEDQEESDFIRMGNIVDVIMTDNDNFHTYFVETSAEKPTAQMLILTDNLYRLTIEDSKDGVVQTSFQDRFEKAYELLRIGNGGKLRDKIETFLSKFETNAKEYFEEKIKSTGKTVITTEERVIAEAIVESLKTSEGTSDVVNAEGLTKYPILFEVGGVPMKMEADKLVFDHENKVIYLYDFKVISFVESFVWESYLKKSYYIQAGVYKFGVEQWKETTEFKDYRVENMAFIVADQKNYYAPLLFKTGDLHYEQSWTGFKVGNKVYNGIFKILENLKLSMEKDLWNVSADNIRNKGKVLIPLFKNLDE